MVDAAKFQTLILMGVAGSGKSTLAQHCAGALGWTYLEGDDFHSDAGKQMMAAGQPLSPALRQQWVELLCQRLQQQKNQGLQTVLSYSGLIQQQRAQIRAAAAAPLFVYLHGPAAILAERLSHRSAHFMPASMLQSQLQDYAGAGAGTGCAVAGPAIAAVSAVKAHRYCAGYGGTIE